MSRKNLNLKEAAERMRWFVRDLPTDKALDVLAELLNGSFAEWMPLFENGSLLDERKLRRLARACQKANLA